MRRPGRPAARRLRWRRATRTEPPPPPRPAPPASTEPAEPGADRATRELAEQVVALAARAARLGLPARELREAVPPPTTGPDPLDPAAGGTATLLAERLSGLDRRDLARVRDRVLAYGRHLDAAAAGPVAVVSDERTGTVRLWWGAHDRAADDGDAGQVVLAGVRDARFGGGGERLSVFVRTVEDPRPDFRKVLTARGVGEALEKLRRDPEDPAARAGALGALSRAPVRDARDWTTAVAEPRIAGAAPSLDATVAVVRSQSVRIGDRDVRRTTILHTISPTVEAAVLLLDNPPLVNGLVDVVAAPDDRAAGAAFADALATAVVRDPAESAAARRAGTVYRPPAVGTTLRITAAPGAGAGRRAAAKNGYLRRARPGTT